MPSVQIRNDQSTDIQGADVIRNGFQFLHEPIGGFAIWNGQFQLGGDPFPEGWQTYSSVGTAYWNRETNGVAGLYCARGGAVAMAIGPTICTLRYMPVDEDENYDIECVAQGKTANSRYSMGALCYNSAKAYLGTAWALANNTPGVAYVRESRRIGPVGDVAWVANTAYARPCWALQNDATLTNEWIEIDDCQFKHSVAPIFIGVRLRDAKDEATATATWEYLDFDTESYDTDTMHEGIANPSRITIKTPGIYAFGATIEWDSNAVGYRLIQINLNRATPIDRDFETPVTGDSTTCRCASTYEFAVTDFIEIRVLQTSGGNLNVLSGSDYSPVFWAHKIGDPT